MLGRTIGIRPPPISVVGVLDVIAKVGAPLVRQVLGEVTAR